jgi:hypothetical protein
MLLQLYNRFAIFAFLISFPAATGVGARFSASQVMSLIFTTGRTDILVCPRRGVLQRKGVPGFRIPHP